VASGARADVAEFTSAQAWQGAVEENYSTIDFTGFPDGTAISNQYSNLGVTFSGLAFIFASAAAVNDNWGLFGPAGLRFTLDTPQHSVAVDYSGAVQFQLFNDGQLLHTSTFFQPGGLGNFAGLISDASFDEVYLFRPFPVNQVFIDDLHWSTSIPAPGALAFVALGALGMPRRRRS
jgi:hypothetical protein